MGADPASYLGGRPCERIQYSIRLENRSKKNIEAKN
jgi:hypothetical protein